MTENRVLNLSSGEGEVFRFPLSFAQQRLWFLHRLEPDSTYNLPLILRLRGKLDVGSLERALSEIVVRHESLRTTFAAEEGTPYQLVHPPRAERLKVVDISEEADTEAAIERLVTEQALLPFDLAVAPRRAVLLRVEPEEHVLVLTFHHIVCDGWSLSVLSRELVAFYIEFSGGSAARLPELPIQYADYAVRQQEWLQGDVLEEQLDYWRTKLEGAPTALDLPTDRLRPPVQSSSGAHLVTTLAPALLERLKALSLDEGVTLFMTLLAAFDVLLARYSRQPDVLVGSPIANRQQVELENLIGFLTNTLVLRADLSDNPSFRELLASVRETVLEAEAHQDLPFELLVEELNPPRDRSRTPLFQVMFSFHNTPDADDVLELPGLTLGTVRLERATTKFDLSLFMRERAEGLRATFEYSTDLFDQTTIERMAGHLETLLTAVAADPDRRVSELPLPTERERLQLLQEWNETARPFPSNSCVHELFEAQAAREPQALALVAGTKRLSYRELDEQANRLAHRLRRLGVGSEVLVGVCLERGPELVVTLLAILKAGGAYVPLDPDYPSERLAFMLDDTHAPVLITQTDLCARLPRYEGELLCLDADAEAIAAESSADPGAGAEADNLAYVMYTSGSTGVPKGVMIEHRAICRLVKGTDYVRFGADEVFLHLAPISFDASTFEIWGALLNGARLVVFPPGPPTVESLRATLEGEGVTTLWLTAALFHHVAAEAPSIFNGLRQLLAGGDVLAGEHVRSAVRALNGGRFINGYGPTEGTTFACCYPVTEATEFGESVSIGRPIANTEAYVLDSDGQLVPIGVPGELYIGGPGLARGYLNRPELTAERFVSRVFSDRPAIRLYRTGDLVRYRRDGNLEFLGRLDDQIKVRGYRVEPGEVETALLDHEGVREAVVVAREETPGDRHLVGYTVSRREPPPSAGELRDFLARRLPDFMIPSAFVALEELPLGPAGKVDRRALPEPDRRQEAHEELVPPRDEVERRLVEIWQRLLATDQPIGVRDEFFAIGGHSLLSLRVIAEIERALGVKLPLSSLFEEQTVERMAALVRELADSEDEWPTLVPLRSGGTLPPLFLLHGRDGELLYYRDFVLSFEPDQPVYGIQPVGLDGRGQPSLSVPQMAAHYVEELRAALPDGPYLLAGYCFSGILAYEVANQLAAQGRAPTFLGLIDAVPSGVVRRRSRIELERTKFADFRSRNLRGKAEWVARRIRGLRTKAGTRLQFVLYEIFDRTGRALPRQLRDVERAMGKALSGYSSPESDVHVTLFQAARDTTDTTPNRSFWALLARQVDRHLIVADGIQHDNMMKLPYANALAAEMSRCIKRSLEELQPDEVGSREKQES